LLSLHQHQFNRREAGLIDRRYRGFGANEHTAVIYSARWVAAWAPVAHQNVSLQPVCIRIISELSIYSLSPIVRECMPDTIGRIVCVIAYSGGKSACNPPFVFSRHLMCAGMCEANGLSNFTQSFAFLTH
jgi:hypothetical protein